MLENETVAAVHCNRHTEAVTCNGISVNLYRGKNRIKQGVEWIQARKVRDSCSFLTLTSTSLVTL